MKNKSLFSFAFFFFITASGFGQIKTTNSVQQVWMGYFNQSRFSNKWGSWLDIHLRTKDDFFTGFSQSIARAGLTYYLNDAVKLTIGDAYIIHFPSDNHKEVSQPEHRSWQQLQWHTNYSGLKTMQWVRLEERFRRKILNDSTLAEGNNFDFRIRYNFLLQVPLTRGKIDPGDFSFVLNDEVHVNFGKQVVYNMFDQNRFFIGLACHVNSHDNLQFGYMNVFQQLLSGNNYRSIHAVRLFYFHNIDWRQKNKANNP